MDAIRLQKRKLDTMPLTEDELKMLGHCRRNIAVVGGGGALMGALGGHFMSAQ